MLVRLADWCYRRRRARRRAVDRGPGGLVRPLQRVRWGVPAGLPAARVGVAGRLGRRSRTASRSRPATPSRSCCTPTTASARPAYRPGPRRSSPTSPRAPTSSAWSARSPTTGARQISADGTTAYAEVALDKKDNEFTAARPRRWSSRSWPPATTPCRWRSAARSPRCPRPPRSASEGIGLVAAAVILLITFGSAVAMGLPLLTALFGLGIAMALGIAADAGGRRPGVGPADRRDGRHRRRHRLRPVHRHPVPQQPRRGPGSAPRHPDGDRDRRSRRAVRRPHRRRVDARHPADGSAGHDRLRLHRRADAAGRHGRVGDAAAGPARLRRVATSSDCTCRS